MQEIFIHKNNMPEAFHEALIALEEQGEILDCSDWGTRQKEISVTMVIDDPLSEPMISRCSMGGPHELEQYKEETIDGILDFKAYDGTEEHTYHQLMADYIGVDKNNNIVSLDQIQFVINELKRNPSTRRAIIDIRNNIRDAETTNPSCLIFIQYFIRDGKLESKVHFRSNDACKAAFMDMFAFMSLQKYIADQLDIPMGAYVHRANSFHSYERDWDLLKSYVKRIKDLREGKHVPKVTANYVGDWEDKMLAEKPKIAKVMEDLRNR